MPVKVFYSAGNSAFEEEVKRLRCLIGSYLLFYLLKKKKWQARSTEWMEMEEDNKNGVKDKIE